MLCKLCHVGDMATVKKRACQGCTMAFKVQTGLGHRHGQGLPDRLFPLKCQKLYDLAFY